MSIATDMKRTEIYDVKVGYDKYGRPVKNSKKEYEDTPSCVIDMCINVQTNYTSNKNQNGEIRFGEITHLGLTTVRGLKKGQKVMQDGHTYMIDLTPNERGRLSQIYLKEVIDDE